MGKVTIAHMNSRNITFFVAFGSLLGLTRHGRRMPWDDDIDLMIPDDSVMRFVEGLDSVASSPWCPDTSSCDFKPRLHAQQVQQSSGCCAWRIQGRVLVSWKPIGMPFKVSTDKEYPLLDFNHYHETDGTLVVPGEQLEYTHFKSFQVPLKEVFPLVSKKLGKLDVFAPRDGAAVLDSLWPKWRERCIVAYNHRVYCNQTMKTDKLGSGCEHPEANAHSARVFKCSKMPSDFLNPAIYAPRRSVPPTDGMEVIECLDRTHEHDFETSPQAVGLEALSKTGLPYVLLAGTLLGYYRDCHVLGHSDVDVGILVSELPGDFPQNLIDFLPIIKAAMAKQGFSLLHEFGKPACGQEFTFVHGNPKSVHPSRKLDIFMIYNETVVPSLAAKSKGFLKEGDDALWSSSHRQGTLRKLYSQSCGFAWAKQHGIRHRIWNCPVDYFRIFYGEDWKKPKTKFDWWADHISAFDSIKMSTTSDMKQCLYSG